MSITFSPSGSGSNDDFVNMANGNAYAVMHLIGMETECCGSIHSEELIAKIDAVTSVKSHTAPTIIDREPGHATMICCGRTEEYLLERLRQLKEMAVKYPGIISWA